jgi:hypothetical protein
VRQRNARLSPFAEHSALPVLPAHSRSLVRPNGGSTPLSSLLSTTGAVPLPRRAAASWRRRPHAPRQGGRWQETIPLLPRPIASAEALLMRWVCAQASHSRAAAHASCASIPSGLRSVGEGPRRGR